MEITKMQQDTIERIRRTKEESQLSITDIMDMLADKGYHQLTESTVKRLFNRNSDPMSFKYRHLMFRERMIDKKDGIIDKLLNAYIESNSKT